MRRFEDARYADRLATIEAIAEPYVVDLGLAGAMAPVRHWLHSAPPSDASVVERAGDLPADVVPAVRIALLRRIVESDLGTAELTEGQVRASLAKLATLGPSDLALELALCAFGIDLGFGISLGWFRLGLLDPALVDLERVEPVDATDQLADEAASLAAVLANDTMIYEAGATDRRFRLLASLQRLRPGPTAALAFDPGDPFGASMRTIADTDEGLARALGAILPLAGKATSVTPGPAQRASIASIVSDESAPGELRGAATRLVHQLLTAPLTPRGPGLVTVRPSNQRLGRGVTWLIPSLFPEQAPDMLGDLGIRLGTSGKRDNQARDAAIANTCATLLGEIVDRQDAAVASLARMLARIRNKPVRKQIEKALAAAAERAGTSVDELVERSLPSYGVDADGRRVFAFDTWSAEIEAEAEGRVRISWTKGGAEDQGEPPRSLRDGAPGDVADVKEVVEDIQATLGDERRRLEQLLAEERRWSFAEWRPRFLEHPLGRIHARRLIWRFTDSSGTSEAMSSADGRLAGRSGSALPLPPDDASVELWHPVEASGGSVDEWRALVVTRQIIQPFKQAFRETYRIDRGSGTDALLDRRFADRPLAYAQMRALMGARGWTAPMLGPFDQGDRSSAFRDFAATGLRAELDHAPVGLGDPRERVDYVRSGTLRFTTGVDEHRSPVLLADVPPRVLSEVLRDVDLFTSVPDPFRRPSSSTDDDLSQVVAVRADALRRLLPTLPHARHLTVVGLWLRVQSGAEAWAISIATGSTVRLPDEEEVTVALPDPLPDVGYLPIEDEILRKVLATAGVLTGRPR